MEKTLFRTLEAVILSRQGSRNELKHARSARVKAKVSVDQKQIVFYLKPDLPTTRSEKSGLWYDVCSLFT